MIRQNEDGTSTSGNWSGYAVTGSGFTKAGGSWIVPAVTCTSGSTYSSFWVGIDGYASGTVEQTGTESDCSGTTPRYDAWYEFCCKEPEIVISGLPIKPGDVMEAKILYDSSGFRLTIEDVTTGGTFRKSGNIAGAQRSSAECIAEEPSSGGILPLADFGTSLFGQDNTGVSGTCYAATSGAPQPFGLFPAFWQITMEGGSGPKAVPSALSSDGSSFSDQWVSSN